MHNLKYTARLPDTRPAPVYRMHNLRRCVIGALVVAVVALGVVFAWRAPIESGRVSSWFIEKAGRYDDKLSLAFHIIERDGIVVELEALMVIASRDDPFVESIPCTVVGFHRVPNGGVSVTLDLPGAPASTAALIPDQRVFAESQDVAMRADREEFVGAFVRVPRRHSHERERRVFASYVLRYTTRFNA